MFQKWKKNKILSKAFKKASEPVWFVYYESNGESGMVKVYAPKESEAREKASYIISDILHGNPFVVTGTAAI